MPKQHCGNARKRDAGAGAAGTGAYIRGRQLGWDRYTPDLAQYPPDHRARVQKSSHPAHFHHHEHYPPGHRVPCRFYPDDCTVCYSGSDSSSQTQVVMVNEAGPIAGLNGATLTSYIGSELNGTTTGSHAPYAISSQPAASLSSLHNQLKNGKLDILLVLARATNQDMRFTYDTNASATNDTNLPTIQGLAQLLTFLDTAHRLGLTSQETQRLSAAT